MSETEALSITAVGESERLKKEKEAIAEKINSLERSKSRYVILGILTVMFPEIAMKIAAVFAFLSVPVAWGLIWILLPLIFVALLGRAWGKQDEYRDAMQQIESTLDAAKSANVQ
jgi:hypothetical protein